MIEIVTFVIVFLTAYVGTAAFRRWSVGNGVIDVPNERSSHVNPTPRGGGVVFVLICLLAYTILAFYFGSLPWGYLTGAILVAGISWLDDLRSISSAWRLAVHFLASAIMILDALSRGSLPDPVTSTGLIVAIAAVIWIVWMINAYNFMDGIDGIAGLQAVVAGIAWSLFAQFTGRQEVSLYAAIVAASALGFLVHNWQPAKIFMGDVGSAFLGFTLAAVPFLAAKSDTERIDLYLGAAIIFLWFFVFDTVITFFRRLVRREKVWQAHRSHLYQRMVISGMSHATVTMIYGSFAAVLSGVFILVAQEDQRAHFSWSIAVLIAIALFSASLVLMSLRKAKA